jgi:hypothetical protein
MVQYKRQSCIRYSVRKDHLAFPEECQSPPENLHPSSEIQIQSQPIPVIYIKYPVKSYVCSNVKHCLQELLALLHGRSHVNLMKQCQQIAPENGRKSTSCKEKNCGVLLSHQMLRVRLTINLTVSLTCRNVQSLYKRPESWLRVTTTVSLCTS